MPVDSKNSTVTNATVARNEISNIFSLGAAGGYAVLGLSNTLVNLSNVTINGGKVGVGAGGSLNFASPTTVNGDLYLHQGVSGNVGGTLNGIKYSNQNLSAAMTDAIQASNQAKNYPPTAVFGTISNLTTIPSVGNLNVINVNNIKLGSGADIVLSGSPTDVFIINVTGGFTMGGNAQIRTTGGAVSSNVFINIIGTGATATSKVTNLINGSILAINRSVTFHGIAGQVICGGNELKLMSAATVNYIPFGV